MCFSSYYDFTGQIPASALTNGGTTFRYKQIDIRQDALSHHLIINIFKGTTPANDTAWGTYRCVQGPKSGPTWQDGEVCDPLNLGFCGAGGDCATRPDPRAVACIGFGPQTASTH